MGERGVNRCVTSSMLIVSAGIRITGYFVHLRSCPVPAGQDPSGVPGPSSARPPYMSRKRLFRLSIRIRMVLGFSLICGVCEFRSVRSGFSGGPRRKVPPAGNLICQTVYHLRTRFGSLDPDSGLMFPQDRNRLEFPFLRKQQLSDVMRAPPSLPPFPAVTEAADGLRGRNAPAGLFFRI